MTNGITSEKFEELLRMYEIRANKFRLLFKEDPFKYVIDKDKRRIDIQKYEQDGSECVRIPDFVTHSWMGAFQDSSCSSIKEIVLGNNMMDASRMLMGIKQKYLRISGGSKNLKYMIDMLAQQSVEYVELDLQNDVKLRGIEGIFSRCMNLRKIKFKQFDTSMCCSFRYAFAECSKLRELDYDSLDFSQARDLQEFIRDQGLTEIKINLTNVKHNTLINLSNFANGCKNLRKAEITGNVKIQNASFMFQDCENLEKVDLEGLDFGPIVNVVGTFADCVQLTEIKGKIRLPNVIHIQRFFDNCRQLEYIDIQEIGLRRADQLAGLFSGCYQLKQVDLQGIDFSLIQKSAENMFFNCKSLESLNLGQAKFSQSISHMFFKCGYKGTVDFTDHFDFSGDSDDNPFIMTSTFQESDISEVIFGNDFNVYQYNIGGPNSVSSQTCHPIVVHAMFNNCTNLKRIVFNGKVMLAIGRNEQARQMFMQLPNLEEVCFFERFNLCLYQKTYEKGIKYQLINFQAKLKRVISSQEIKNPENLIDNFRIARCFYKQAENLWVYEFNT